MAWADWQFGAESWSKSKWSFLHLLQSLSRNMVRPFGFMYALAISNHSVSAGTLVTRKYVRHVTCGATQKIWFPDPLTWILISIMVYSKCVRPSPWIYFCEFVLFSSLHCCGISLLIVSHLIVIFIWLQLESWFLDSGLFVLKSSAL